MNLSPGESDRIDARESREFARVRETTKTTATSKANFREAASLVDQEGELILAAFRILASLVARNGLRGEPLCLPRIRYQVSPAYCSSEQRERR